MSFSFVAALLGYRWMRTTQMVTQYRWLYRAHEPANLGGALVIFARYAAIKMGVELFQAASMEGL